MRGDKVTRKNGAGERRGKKDKVKRRRRRSKRGRGRRTKDEELREAIVGWSHLLLAAHRPSSFRVGPRRVSEGKR